MTKPAKQSKPQSTRFSLYHDGLTEFLVAFQIIWAAVRALYKGPHGENDQTRNFVRRMEQMVRHASPLLEDGETDHNSYEKTIKLGAALMRQIEEYIDDILDSDRAREFFDRASSEIQEIWPEVWAAKKNEILESRARFQQANASETAEDLKKIVLAYNATTELLARAKAEAENKASAEANRLRQAKEAQEKLARFEKNRTRGRSVLAQLSA